MIRVKIVHQPEKSFNGLDVFLNVVESDGGKCQGCGRDDGSAITRRFGIAKIQRGAVGLLSNTHFSREVLRYVREKMGHGQSLCLGCFEELVDNTLGGFEPAD